jgi:hypothetical protein
MKVVIAVPVTDLFHGAAQQHHVVGRCQAHRRLERELALSDRTRLDRSQRQAERTMSRLTISSTGSI